MTAFAHRDPYGRLITPWSIVEVGMWGTWRRGRVILLRRESVVVEVTSRRSGRVRTVWRRPEHVYVVRGD